MDFENVRRLVYQDVDSSKKLLDESGAAIMRCTVRDALDGENVEIIMSVGFNPDEYGQWKETIHFTHYHNKDADDETVVESIYAIAADKVEDTVGCQWWD